MAQEYKTRTRKRLRFITAVPRFKVAKFDYHRHVAFKKRPKRLAVQLA